MPDRSTNPWHPFNAASNSSIESSPGHLPQTSFSQTGSTAILPDSKSSSEKAGLAAGESASVHLTEVAVSLVLAKSHLASIRSSVFCSLPESFPSRPALPIRHLEKQQKRQPLRARPEPLSGVYPERSRRAQDKPRRRIVAVRQPVIAKDVTVVPEFLDELLGNIHRVALNVVLKVRTDFTNATISHKNFSYRVRKMNGNRLVLSQLATVIIELS